MKKVLTLVVVVAALQSCKKDYTCNCSQVTIPNGGAASAPVVTEIKYFKAKKHDVASNCLSTKTTLNNGDAIERTCTLK